MSFAENPPERQLFTSPGREDKESVVDNVIARISEEIVAGRLCPGQRIPTEPELAERLGVGRNSLREAIKILVAMGVLDIRRADGTYVTQGFSPRMLEPVLYGIMMGSGEVRDLLDLRRLLESGILRLAAGRRTPTGTARLESALHALASSLADGNLESIVEHDLRFHRVLTAMCDNPLFNRMEGMLERMTLALRRNAVRHAMAMDGGRAMLARHTAVFRAVADGDLQTVSFIGDEMFELLEQMRLE